MFAPHKNDFDDVCMPYHIEKEWLCIAALF